MSPCSSCPRKKFNKWLEQTMTAKTSSKDSVCTELDWGYYASRFALFHGFLAKKTNICPAKGKEEDSLPYCSFTLAISSNAALCCVATEDVKVLLIKLVVKTKRNIQFRSVDRFIAVDVRLFDKFVL